MLHEKKISSQTRLKALVQSLEWTYGVLWRLSPNERVLEWVHGWFNPTSLEFGPTLAPQFYSIFKDPDSQGYAALALQRDSRSPLWWTSKMPQAPTDKCKTQFLQEAGIQTIVCIPELGGDGVQYCTELATSSLVPQMDSLMNSLQDYVSMSVTPHTFGRVSPSPSSELDSSGQGYGTLDSGTSVAQMMASEGLPGAGAFTPPLNLHTYTPGDFNESLASSGEILRSEEPYFQWTSLGNQSLFFDDQLQSGFFGDLDIDVDVEKSLFSPLDCKVETKSSSNVDVMNPYTWDSNTFDPEEVVRQAAGLPEFYAPVSPLQHSTHVNSESSQPAQIAELSSTEPRDSSPSLGTVSLQTDLRSSSFSQLLEPSRSYGTEHKAPVTGTEQTTSKSDAFELRQTTQCASFAQNPAGWPYAYHGSNLTMDVHDNELAWPSSHFRHSQQSLFQQSECKPNLLICRVGDDHASPRQSLFRRWTDKIVPIIQEEAERQKLEEQQLAKSKLNPTCTSTDNMRSSNPAHDEAAHIHKLAERHRRSKFNEKLHTISTLVPTIKKKDRVSILSHAIDYIRQLQAEVAQLQEKSAAPVLEQQQGGSTTADKVQPLANIITSKQAHGEEDFEGGLRFGVEADLLKVAVYPGNEDGMVIKVEANNSQTQMLIEILNASRDLGLEVRCFNSKCINNQMHVTVTATAQGKYEMMSSEQVQEVLQRVLVPFDSSPSSTISSGIENLQYTSS